MEEKVKVVANRIKTPDGTILWSRYTHDYVQYHDKVSDEDYMLDGGNEYRRSFINEVQAENMTVTNKDPWEVQREVILRGTFDSKGVRVWVPLSKLSNEHLINLASLMSNTNNNYQRELNYRHKNDIKVPEHDYDGEGVEAITPSVE